MTPEEIALVRQGFDRLAPDAERVGAAIYDAIFALDPSLRALFGSDLHVHARKLMEAVAAVVAGLDNFEAMRNDIVALGRRHVRYGARPQHLQTVGSAVLATLAAGLGADFTPAARDAWTKAWLALAGVMERAMAEELRQAA